MNGLEAIELMKQGETVRKYGGELYRIIDGYVRVKVADGAPWEIEVSFDFFATYEEYDDLSGWERAERFGTFYFGNAVGKSVCEIDGRDSRDRELYEVANYFFTREKAEEINFKQTLFRRMQRFSDENGWNENDWTHEGRRQWFISYDYDKDKFVIDSYLTFRDFGQVYFVSLDVAREALELFKEDLIKYYTHDWSKGE